jgi:AAA family ATP:ADP antiporter
MNKVKTEEWYAVILSFIYFFCILGAYYVMRPMRDQLAVEVGSSQLPGYFAATLLVTIILTPLFSLIVSRWKRAVVMPFVYIFFIACQLAFIPLFNNHALMPVKTLGFLFFVWVSVFNLFVVSVFWSFMTDIWDDFQARRLFPIIAFGGTLGAIFGPMVTRELVGVIGSGELLLVSACLLMIAVLCIFLLGDWARKYGSHRDEHGSEDAVGGGMLDGLKQVFTNPFIATMAVMMLLSDAIGTTGYVLVTDYSGAAFKGDAIAQTKFAADMDLASNVLQIVFQLAVTRFLLVRYGAGSVFAIGCGVVVAMCLGLAFMENPYALLFWGMPAIALVLVMTRAMAHGMFQPARETLYTLVPRTLRYKGKNAVDTVVWRAGDVASLSWVKGLQGLGIHASGFALIWALLAGLSGWIGWRLANKVERHEFE